jgi:hypothetical protein
MVDQGDELMNPFKGQTRLFVNYGLQRAFEKDRKVAEFAKYYRDMVQLETTEVIQRLKARIKAVGKAVVQSAFNDIEQVF